MPEIYKTTLVRIMGEDYPIRSDADASYLQNLARFVEEKIVTVASKNKLPPRLKREVLAALLLADSYFTEKKRNDELEQRLADLTASINDTLADECLLEQ